MSDFKVGDKVKFTGGVSYEINTATLVEFVGSSDRPEWFIAQDITGNIVSRFEDCLELLEVTQ